MKRYYKPRLQHNDIEIYSRHDEGKSVVAKRFIKTLKYKIHKYKTAISKSLHINNLNNLVNKYNSTYLRTMKIRLIDVETTTDFEFGVGNNVKDPKFQFGDHLRTSKYKNIYAKGYTPNRSEEVFIIKKVEIVMEKKLLGHFV